MYELIAQSSAWKSPQRSHLEFCNFETKTETHSNRLNLEYEAKHNLRTVPLNAIVFLQETNRLFVFVQIWSVRMAWVATSWKSWKTLAPTYRKPSRPTITKTNCHNPK